MTLQQSRRLQSLLLGTLAWAIAILIFFPIFWMVLTSFKTEIDAFATPPQFIFTPTLENYLHINERSNYFSYAWNSVLISFSATALCLLISVPVSYVLIKHYSIYGAAWGNVFAIIVQLGVIALLTRMTGAKKAALSWA